MLGSNKRICFLFYKTWKVHGKFQEPQTQDSKCEIEDVEWRRLKFKTNCERCVLNKLLTIWYWEVPGASNFSVYLGTTTYSFMIQPAWKAWGCLTGPYWSLLILTGPFWAFLGLSGPYWALLGLTGPYWALLSLTGPYWDLLGLSGPY